MPEDSGRRKCLEWWIKRSTYEKSLILLITASVIVIIVLLSVGGSGTPSAESALPKFCTTPTCLKEAAKILDTVDPNAQPCGEFYQFTCGNFLANSDPQERVDLKDYGERTLIDIYKEDVDKNDHKMVAAAKELFQACTDEVEIERDELKTFKEALTSAGGWPVVEGPDWNQPNFDWLKATYKFRELGYFYKVFLELSVADDPHVVQRFILQVSTGIADDSYLIFDERKIELMTDIAVIFGATDRDRAKEELKEAFTFWKKLHQKQYPAHSGKEFGEYTVNNYQEQFLAISWLKFINNITKPVLAIEDTERVLFPPVETMSEWLEIIASTEKRIQANYMMWMVVEKTIPILHRQLRLYKGGPRKLETQEQSCLVDVERSFFISPIRLIADERHLSRERRQKAQEVLGNIKTELATIVKSMPWIEENDREKTMRIIDAMILMVERPEDFDTKQVLDDMMVDMIGVKHKSFLNLISQAERNKISATYRELRKLRSQAYLKKWPYKNEEIEYDATSNTFFVPGFAFHKSFNEKRPHYLNYGTIGAVVGDDFGSVIDTLGEVHWSNVTKERFDEINECLREELHDYIATIDAPKYLDRTIVKAVTRQTIGQVISHAAYYKWLKKNAKELPLIATPFTTRQLFWISAANVFCPRGQKWLPRIRHKSNDFKLALVMGNSSYFKSDFSCSTNQISVFKKCNLF